MGDNCTSKEDSQLTAPQEELARSSKVEPKRKPYHMDEGKDANVLCKESSLQSDDLGSDTDEPDQTDSENEMNSKESSFLGSSSDTDDPDETDSEKEMNSKKSSFLGCSSGMSDKDQMKTPPKEKINPSLIKVESRKCRCLRSMMQKLGLRHSKSFSVRSETANVHVKEKACGTSDDLCEEHPQASEEGSKPSLVAVQSRRHRYIVAILRKLGIRCSVTSTINEMSETMLQKTCGTNDDIDDDEEDNNEDDFGKENNLQSDALDIDDDEEDNNEDDFDIDDDEEDNNEDDFDIDDDEEDNNEDDFDIDDDEEDNNEDDFDIDDDEEDNNEDDFDIDDKEEDENEHDFGMSDKDQMKTPPKEKINPSLIKVESRKCRCLRSMMQKLGLRHSKSFSVRSETANVHVTEKACGTSDDLCEEHPQASEEGSKPSLVAVQSRRHRYIVAILRKLGIRCSVTSTINERSETMLQKTCGTNDDIDDKEEDENEHDFGMSDKDQMKTPPKEKINPSLIKVESRKCRCLRSMMQKLGLRHSKSFSVRSETANVHVKEKACGTSDDLCEEHPQASEEGSKPSLVAVQSRRHRYIVAILRKLGIRCSVTSTINERSETMLQKTCGTNDDIDDKEEDDNEHDFGMSDKDQMKTPPKEKINPSLIKVESRKCRCLRSMMQKLGLRHSKSFSVRSETANVHVKEKACGTSDDLCEEHPQASEEGSKSSLVAVQSRRHRYIVAILRKLGIRCSVTSTINEMSETMLQKTCGTNDDIDDDEEDNNEDDFDIDDKEEDENEHDFGMSDKDQMKTPPKEKINPSLIKVESRKCRCLRSMMQKLGLRHSKSFSVRSETANVHVTEKACGTSDDLCEEHPQASEEGSKPSLVAVQSRRHRYIVAILRKLGIRCSVTSTINERSETMLQKTCGTNDDIDDKEEDNNEDDFDIDDKEEDNNEDDFDPAELETASVGPPRAAWEE
ncbi:uncharacterized protein LOC143274202 [Peromyscus maniculatus bairdii]|uniref:uncharacterized protein LOC143274202 n=1 Tax=Peromyscus maniculatus bairdii TaxID=230844 RepID=UPI003FD13A34